MLILLGSLVACLLLGVPIAYSLGLSGFLYFLLVHPELLTVLPQRLAAGMDSYAMIALPLFIAMGLLMNAGGVTSRLIDFSMLFVGRFRGGLGAVNVLASMIFGGISGSSVSDTASVGAVLIPEMVKKGYSPQFSSGITVASSTMGMIIPPSVPMIIYALGLPGVRGPAVHGQPHPRACSSACSCWASPCSTRPSSATPRKRWS